MAIASGTLSRRKYKWADSKIGLDRAHVPRRDSATRNRDSKDVFICRYLDTLASVLDQYGHLDVVGGVYFPKITQRK